MTKMPSENDTIAAVAGINGGRAGHSAKILVFFFAAPAKGFGRDVSGNASVTRFVRTAAKRFGRTGVLAPGFFWTPTAACA